MKYFLIGNNTKITNKTIESLDITEDDVIILYSCQMPLKWDKLKNHNKIWLFLRTNSTGFWCINTIKYYIDNKKYLKIIFSGTKIEERKYYKYYKHYNKVEKYDERNTLEYISFPKGKVPQTGLYSYLYLKKILNTEDKIYLIGFTNSYNNSGWVGHSKEIEQVYYKSEMLLNKNIIKIDE